jgi:phosphoribosyl 1,2-cyclic phosphodiesterase
LSVHVLSLGSGSSGNALLISAPGCNLLVDCGLGVRTIAAGMKSLGLDWGSLSGVLITHEHSDHIRAIDSIVRKGIPIHCSKGTAIGSRLSPRQYQQLSLDHELQIDSATVHPVPLSHDAAEPCGFFIEIPGQAISIITDTGEARDYFLEPIRLSKLVVFEANHDLQMLRSGPYPWHLKRRVESSRGHLSNADCGATLRRALEDGARPDVWLAHLSETNNHPDLALQTVRRQLGDMSDVLRIEALTRRGEFYRRPANADPMPSQLSLF